MSKVEIYYFSGTGNSLYVAKELQKRIPQVELIPIVNLLRKDAIETHAEIVGFVFPLHGMTLPIPVKKFLEKVSLKSSQYNFAVATRGGTKCFAFKKIDRILKKRAHLDSHFCLNMSSNDPKFQVYDIPTNETIAKMESQIEHQIDLIKEVILNRLENRGTDLKFIAPSGFVLERLVLLGMFIAEHTHIKDYFRSDAKCNGCGVCTVVCPSQKIKIVDQKPIWQNNKLCYMCYACLNFCPQQSVQISSKWFMKSYTEKNGRYSHPYATVKDIAGQK